MTILEHPMMKNLAEVYTFQLTCDVALFGEEDASREDLEELWNGIDPCRDAWVARDNAGALNGYACLSNAVHGLQQDIYIHPQASPEELEDALMSACIERAQRVIAEEKPGMESLLTGYASVTDVRLMAVYDRFGFAQHARHYNMQINLEASHPAPVWPAQYTVSRFEPAEERELYEFIETALTRPGRDPAPFEFWRSSLLRGGRYDPELFEIAREGGRIVGAALSYDEETGGWVRQLAVAADQRGRGLGSLLLQQLFSEFAQRSKKKVALAVSAQNENALKVYERAGMFRSREFIEYRLNLRP